MQVGIDITRMRRFVHFFGEKGRSLASMVSLENGDTTLSLGDRGWEGRIILGALQSDTPSERPSDEWGLVFRRPGSTQPLLSALMTTRQSAAKPFAGIRLIRENGEEWEVR